MRLVDADAHVIECEATWDYLEGADQRFRPIAVVADRAEDRWWNTYWQIDGQTHARAGGDPNLPISIRDMSDIEGRLRIMDQLRVDVQVLYPTLFLQGMLTQFPEGQIALTRAYNRWLADVTRKGEGRLPWVVIPPLASMPDALAEVEFGKANGACGVFMRGVEENRVVKDPYFFPLYEKAQELDLPICIHAGNGSNGMRDIFNRQDRFQMSVTPVLSAFNALLTAGIPTRFPELRFGFIEVGAQWVPYLVKEAIRRHERIKTPGVIEDETTALRDNRLYVTCRTDDDLAYIVKSAGEDNLLIGTDFGHEDPAAEMDALANLRLKSGVEPGVIDKILDANARTFYGL